MKSVPVAVSMITTRKLYVIAGKWMLTYCVNGVRY